MRLGEKGAGGGRIGWGSKPVDFAKGGGAKVRVFVAAHVQVVVALVQVADDAIDDLALPLGRIDLQGVCYG